MIKRCANRAALFALLLFCLSGLPAAAATDEEALLLGITPVFLIDEARFLEDWRAYLSERLDRPVRLVRRKTYAEITDMLLSGQLHAAWLCSFPYVAHRAELRLLSTPVFRGEPLYHSYLVVPVDDDSTSGYLDLRGKSFAYVEPRSNSGYLYPRYAIHRLGTNPDTFFRASFFTGSHSDSIAAVAEGLADAAAVDGYIWEALSLDQPAITQRTRVVARSPAFGFPPVVAGPVLDPRLADQLGEILMGMRLDPAGRRLLDRLHLDGFGPPGEALYDGIAPMMGAVATRR